jgi:sarcosine reductase
MKPLELATYPVESLRFGSQSSYSNRTLEVNKRELSEAALCDPRILGADFAIVHPGDSVRVTGIRDVVEPRVKVTGKAQVFPGITAPVIPVGEGRTNRLSGMTLVTAAEYEGVIRTGTTAQRSAILDMSGPGADFSPFSQFSNLVLSLRLPPNLPEAEAHQAIQRAEYRVARILAQTTTDLGTENVEIYDLGSAASGLPTTVLVIGCITEGEHLPTGVSYYGLPIRESLSTVVHPNELIDGAVTGNTLKTVSYYPTTWDWQNQPLSLGLAREHGRTVGFAGVILQRIRFETFQEKEVAAHNASQVAESLGADAALMTWLGSGNAFLEVMLTVRALESKGIRTVLVTYEYGGRYGTDSPLLFYDESADAVVSTGSRDTPVDLPAVERVVGAYDRLQVLNYPGAPYVSAAEAMTLDATDAIIGGIDLWGGRDWTCKLY